MPVVMRKSEREIRFTVWGAICQRILDWEFARDEMVFNEQLATGSFRGRFPVDDELLAILREIKAKGQIAPYYGAGGSRGACVYYLRRSNSGYEVRVENTTVKESAEFGDKSEEFALENLPSRVQTWLALNLRLGQVVKPYLVLSIDGKELQNLRKWEYWVESQASTARYIYEFGQVSLGRLGYTVSVEDTQTINRINVTDYGDW